MTTPARAVVLSTSDRHLAAATEDPCLAPVRAKLEELGFRAEIHGTVPKDRDALAAAVTSLLSHAPRYDLIVVCGGTGLGPGDHAPQVLASFADYDVPGFGELMRQGSLAYSRNAPLSRCGAWVAGRTLLLAVAGNQKAAIEHLGFVEDVLPHAIHALGGPCRDRRRKDTSREELR